MGLTTKDLIATLLVALAVLLYYAHTRRMSVPLISNVRVVITEVALIGFIAHIFGKTASDNAGSSPLLPLLAVLGWLSMVLIIIGLITGKKTILLTLEGATVLLWLLTTIRHIAG